MMATIESLFEKVTHNWAHLAISSVHTTFQGLVLEGESRALGPKVLEFYFLQSVLLFFCNCRIALSSIFPVLTKAPLDNSTVMFVDECFQYLS